MHSSQLNLNTAYEPYSGADNDDVHAEKLRQQRMAGTTRNAKQKEGRSKQVLDSVRIVLRLLALAFALSIIGVQSHVAWVWNQSRNETVQNPQSGFRMRAWAAQMDLWPTWVNIGAGVIASVIHISSLITLCGGVRALRQNKLYPWVVVLLSTFSIVAWIAAVVYYKVDNTRGKKHWDIWSWSCTHETWKGSKVSFEPLCVELNYSFYALIISAVIEIVCLTIFFIIRGRERKQRQYKPFVTVTGSA
ncbi:hypothetical protein TARUN_2219 [Trichoderma arundinaceum]|uniref:Uncharacterized protein n=1 Tax=Trichoderma arundinaceum TaxID=490622 RepID=A0A395NW19_TRIAR|nr:hypothetical protein TARUN_2219 [Trichoderma arundinaceum]